MGIINKLFSRSGKSRDNNNQSNLTYQGKAFRNEVELDMYKSNQFGYKDLKDNLDYQDKLLSMVNNANAQFEKDGNLDALIKIYEYAFIESKPPCKTSQNLKLVDFYMKAGFNDKAWGYLNLLLTSREAPLEKIRFAQGRILKKEKKYFDAIEMYMLGHLAKSEWNNTFHSDLFFKDVKSMINKVGWDDDDLSHLADIVSAHIKKRRYNESELIKKYREYIATKQ